MTSIAMTTCTSPLRMVFSSCSSTTITLTLLDDDDASSVVWVNNTKNASKDTDADR